MRFADQSVPGKFDVDSIFVSNSLLCHSLLTRRSFFFFGGLSIPLTQAILAHLFSYNISWSATVKEVHRSNFFMEIPKIIRR